MIIPTCLSFKNNKIKNDIFNRVSGRIFQRDKQSSYEFTTDINVFSDIALLKLLNRARLNVRHGYRNIRRQSSTAEVRPLLNARAFDYCVSRISNDRHTK